MQNDEHVNFRLVAFLFLMHPPLIEAVGCVTNMMEYYTEKQLSYQMEFMESERSQYLV